MNPFVDNPNLRWAAAAVDALVQSGLTDVVIAPGSRSTPLTLACAAHPGLRIFRHRDERGAGFFALGLARATNRPVATLCTSGTATVNFHPAIVEAQMSQVPLLILTADRPPELRGSGANQTTDQVDQFGRHVLWAVDMPLPEANARELLLRNVRGLAARAYATANGLVPGPVHLNFPFRKPLEPAEPAAREALSALISQRNPAETDVLPGGTETRLARGTLQPTADQIAQLASLPAGHERGLIVCGPGCPGGEFPAAVAALARQAGWPVAADPLSGVRFGPHVAEMPQFSAYETLLSGGRDPGWAAPEVVVRFGAVPTSKWLNDYLDRIRPAARVHVRSAGAWADDSHRTSYFLQADETAVCQALANAVQPRPAGAWLAAVTAVEQAAWQVADRELAAHWFDAAVIPELFARLPEPVVVVAGNSLPVRHVDQFAAPTPRRLAVVGNRGASGIDGVISTALGVAAGQPAPVYLLIGDVSFLHDLNGLLAARDHDLAPVTIVLLNNDGGGIFRRLPVAAIEPPFDDLFLTPHGIDFAPLVRGLGWRYVLAQDRAGLRTALDARRGAGGHEVIEVRTAGAADERARRAAVRAVLDAVEARA